jgi:hypothetical protein
LSYPGSIDGTGLNLPLESNAIQARDLEVRGSNPGPGSNFPLEFKRTINYMCH